MLTYLSVCSRCWTVFMHKITSCSVLESATPSTLFLLHFHKIQIEPEAEVSIYRQRDWGWSGSWQSALQEAVWDFNPPVAGGVRVGGGCLRDEQARANTPCLNEISFCRGSEPNSECMRWLMNEIKVGGSEAGERLDRGRKKVWMSIQLRLVTELQQASNYMKSIKRLRKDP